MNRLSSLALTAALMAGVAAYAQQATPNAAPGTNSATQDSAAPGKPNMCNPSTPKPANATPKDQKKAEKADAKAAKKAAKADKTNASQPM